MKVHLVDGTYELFRHHFGQRPREGADGTQIAAVRGVLLTVLSMIADGVTHLGVATDHVISSFRNDLWPGYKSEAGVDPVLLAQFEPLEEALAALGVAVWPMVELEADDGLASAAALASRDARVDQIVICTPDKDLGQCVAGDRVVQFDRRSGEVRDETAVIARYGVAPRSIPDWLALTGDSADGFPGLPGWGARSASAVLAHYGSIEAIPDRVGAWDPSVRGKVRGADRLCATLAQGRQLAALFKTLATLRVDEPLFQGVDALRWRGPTEAFGAVVRQLGDPALLDRALRLAPTG